MGHKRKRLFKKLKTRNIITIIAGSLGFGMILVIILPAWVWILIVGAALIGAAWCYLCN